jgi:hypothetical protein
VETPIIVALIGAIVVLIGHFVKQHFDRLAELEREQRAKKIPIYTELLELIQSALFASNSQDAPKRNPMMTSKVISWAPSSVVIAYIDVWQMIEGKPASPAELEKAVGELLAAIRQDLGQSDKNAGVDFHLLTAKVFLNDCKASKPSLSPTAEAVPEKKAEIK